MRLTLPYPPTANLYWRVWRGRAVKSTEARAYQETVKRLALLDGPRRPLAGLLSVAMDVYRPRRRGDLDNTLKVILDALKGIAFDDDDQIEVIVARRFDDKAKPRAEITIEPLETP